MMGHGSHVLDLAHRTIQARFATSASGESLHRRLCQPLPDGLACHASGRRVGGQERLRRRTWLLRLLVRLIPDNHVIAGDQLLQIVNAGPLYDRICPWESFVGLVSALYPRLLTAFQELGGDWHLCEEALKPVLTMLYYGGLWPYLDRAHLPSREEWYRRLQRQDPADCPTASLLQRRRWHADRCRSDWLTVVEHNCIFYAVLPPTGRRVATLTTAGCNEESEPRVLVVETLNVGTAYLGLGIELRLLLDAASAMEATRLVWSRESVAEDRWHELVMYTLGGYYDKANRQWCVELSL